MKKIIIPICKYCGKPRNEHVFPEWDIHQLKHGGMIK